MNNQTNSNEQHWMLLVIMLQEIANKKGISQKDIAELTGLKQSNISRMFALQYCPTLRNFISIARAIKVNFFFEDQESLTDLNQIFESAMEELGRRPEKFPKN